MNANYREAGVEALADLAAPTLMSYASTASQVLDVVVAAFCLAEPAMEEAEVPQMYAA